MTLRLILMRHAKSDWENGARTDHERPLNERGRLAAPLVAQELRRRGWIPNLVRSSDSIRTRQTWTFMRGELPPVDDVRFTADLYHAGHHALAKILRNIPSDVKTVLAIGHNPGWQHAVEYYSGESVQFTTANAALLELDGDDWEEGATSRAGWQLVDVIRPRDLGPADLE
jgi:phosphohistidine phosphatase